MSLNRPPKLPLKLFRLFCSEERVEELEGDLYEVYNDFVEERGSRFAKLFYWWLIIRSFRPFALKRTKMKNNRSDTSLAYLKHNLLITWRNMLKNKVTTAINVFGLAIGIGVFLAFLRIIQFELDANTQVPDKERIYRVYSSANDSFTRGVSNPACAQVKESISGLDAVTHFHTFNSNVILPGAQQRNLGRGEKLIIADSSYFNVFGHYRWLVGSKSKSLVEPYKVVLEAMQAEKYFGHRDWVEMIGEEIIYKDSISVFVSGIVEQDDIVTDLSFTDFISFSTINNSPLQKRYGADNWGSYSSSQLWLKLKENVNKADILLQLEGVAKLAKKEVNSPEWSITYLLQPLSDLHFNNQLNIFDFTRKPAHIPTLTTIGLIAFAILLIAIFNFVNLETAQASTKSKEVGVKKVLGSSRKHLVGRFLSESIMISLLAVLLAVPIVHYGLEYYKEYLPETITLNYDDAFFWIGLLIIALSVGLLAGIYPSWVISSSQPIRILYRNSESLGLGGAFVRKLLIFLQFLFSQLLIFGTIVISFQTSFMLDKELGFNKEGVIYFHTPYTESIRKQDLILDKLKEIPEISKYSLFNSTPVGGYSSNEIEFESPNGDRKFEVYQKTGDTTFIDFFDIELLAGRNIASVNRLNEAIINEKFSEELGFNNPSESVGSSFEFSDKTFYIVGVIENFNFRSLHHPMAPMFYSYKSNSTGVGVKIENSDQMVKAVDKLTDHWEEIYPKSPLNIYFMDENIENFYLAERRTSKMVSTATIVAIFISCLGLFGLVSFVIIRRTKELGIRKVLGASFFQISKSLSKEFILLIVLALIISTPISYYLISNWMESFAYKIEISIWIYLLGGVLSLIIALGFIGFKVWNASKINPIESLRYE